jgi:hypothetical protein
MANAFRRDVASTTGGSIAFLASQLFALRHKLGVLKPVVSPHCGTPTRQCDASTLTATLTISHRCPVLPVVLLWRLGLCWLQAPQRPLPLPIVPKPIERRWDCKV